MRTTITLDDEVFRVARAMADARDVSIGDMVSELARRGMASESRITKTPRGFPVFRVSPDAKPITPDDVRRSEDEA